MARTVSGADVDNWLDPLCRQIRDADRKKAWACKDKDRVYEIAEALDWDETFLLDLIGLLVERIESTSDE